MRYPAVVEDQNGKIVAKYVVEIFDEDYDQLASLLDTALWNMVRDSGHSLSVKFLEADCNEM